MEDEFAGLEAAWDDVEEYPVCVDPEAEAVGDAECLVDDEVTLPYGGTGVVVYTPPFEDAEMAEVDVL